MFLINMAGLTIGIIHRYPYVKALCRDFITENAEANFTVSATDEEIRVQQEQDDSPSMPGYCEALCLYRNICLRMPEFDGFLIHGAAIAVDGEGYLFLAKSGVGKTTHMRLWMDAFGSRAQVVNGDKPILRCIDGQWCVCGTPWRGKEFLGSNKIVPLKALCFVERGPDNAIRPLPQDQVIGRIFHQLLMPRDEAHLTAFFTLLENMLAKLPCYMLRCNRDSGAALVAYEGMQQS